MSIDAPGQAQASVPYPSAPPYGSPTSPPLLYPGPPRRGRGAVGFVVGAVAAVLVAGVAVGAYAAGRSASPTAPARPAAPSNVAPYPPPTLTPEAAQAQTCGVLKTDYPGVAHAVEERNTFNHAPWTDPGLLASVDTLVTTASSLADKLERSLRPETPAALRSAVVDYVAGLRALSISERNHSKDLQLNGVALFYNQVLEPPLRICDIPN